MTRSSFCCTCFLKSMKSHIFHLLQRMWPLCSGVMPRVSQNHPNTVMCL
uniref:Uncharacterized protein n=1 Tax=Anguilla anguilla TaxID=7936 RepID=A0A0E9WUT5_ANGAN